MSTRDARAAGRSPSAAEALRRLAVLLEAGLAPSAAWAHLGTPAGRRIADVLARGEPGAALIATTPGPGWQAAAAAWEVAEASGAPLGGCLRALATTLLALDQARRDAEVALAGPRATARLVLALPVLGLLLGALLGVDGAAVLVSSPFGWALTVAAAALVGLARMWTARLLRRARPPSTLAGLELDLVAAALAGGGAWPEARARVTAALGQWCPGSNAAGESDEVTGILRLADAAGVPASELLRGAADERRRDARARDAAAVERLAVRLMLPLGVCILPAFVLVGVVPLVLALLSSTGASF